MGDFIFTDFADQNELPKLTVCKNVEIILQIKSDLLRTTNLTPRHIISSI